MKGKQKKYTKVCTGIRKNNFTRGKDAKIYLAEKKINKTRYSESFKQLKDAKEWYRTFNLTSSGQSANKTKAPSSDLNGNYTARFGCTWDEYEYFKKGSLETSSINLMSRVGRNFDDQLRALKICEITPVEITHYLNVKAQT
jgi:hypothetical protein